MSYPISVFRYAVGIADEPQPFDKYFNLDLSLNAGFAEGLQTSLDFWPETTQENTINGQIVDSSFEAFRLLIGYRYSFLLPLVGVIDVTPTVGFWNFDVTSNAGEIESWNK